MKAARLNEQDKIWEQHMPIKDWYTIQGVCMILNVGGPSVYGAIKRGTMKGHRVNGVVHVSHENLLAYISRRAASPTFDPSQLDIQEILPAAVAEQAAASMTPTGAAPADAEVNLDFLKDED